MMKRAIWAAAAVTCFALAGAAVGADDREQVMEMAARNGWVMLVQECDKDGNGELSVTEFATIQKNPTLAAEKFAAMDLDHDGAVVEDEYVAWAKTSMHPARRK